MHTLHFRPTPQSHSHSQTYTFEELSEAFSALIQQRHSEIRDAGKEITKLLSSSNRVLKVGGLDVSGLMLFTVEATVIRAGKEIMKLLSSSNRVLEVGVGCLCSCSFSFNLSI